jgi:hypothetical protein
VGFANVSTAVVGRSRGTPIVSVAQLGYIAVTVLWREETDIKTLKDLEGKSWAISPGQAQWFLLPALAKINNVDFASIKIQETAPPLQPAALLAKKADFITMFRASNDEVADMAAAKQGIRIKRLHMRDAGLDIYGSALIAKEEDIKRRPEMIRAYVEGTMEGLRYTRDHLEEALGILLKLKPELDRELTRIQIKNGVEEVFIPAESVASGYGYMKPDIMEKTVKITNECHKQVHFGPQIVEVARTTCRLSDLHGPVRPDLHPHERNKGVGNLSLVEAVWSQRHGEVITAVTRTGHPVTDTVQLLAAHGAVGVAFIIGVADDGHHRITDNGVKHVPLAQLAPLVEKQTVAHVEVFRHITLVKANQIRHLLAFHVHEPQHLPSLDRESRVLLSRDDPFFHNRARYGITPHR